MKKGEIKIGESLKRFRREKGISQKTVAEKLGIMPQAYYRYESDKFVPTADIIIKIAQAYDVSADYLLGLDDEPTRPLPIDTASVADTDVDELTRAAENNRVLEYHQALANILSKQGIKI